MTAYLGSLPDDLVEAYLFFQKLLAGEW